MKTYIKHKTVVINGKSRVLYKKAKSKAFYIKHKGKMITFSAYKKMKGGQDNNPVSAFDCSYVDSNNNKINIGSDFNEDFKSLFDILDNDLKVFRFYDEDKIMKYDSYAFSIVNASGQTILEMDHYSDEPGDTLLYTIKHFDYESLYEFHFPVDTKGISEKCYHLTRNVLYSKMHNILKAYNDKYNPLRIYASMNDGKYDGLIFLHKTYAVHFNLFSSLISNNTDNDYYVIQFRISYISGLSTMSYLRTLIDYNKKNKWKLIYKDNLNKVKIDALIKTLKTSSPKPKSSANLFSIEPALIESIFQTAQESDKLFTNKQMTYYLFKVLNKNNRTTIS